MTRLPRRDFLRGIGAALAGLMGFRAAKASVMPEATRLKPVFGMGGYSWNRALTPDEHAALAADPWAPLNPDHPLARGMVRFWPLNKGCRT